jgi:hypothetical protein
MLFRTLVCTCARRGASAVTEFAPTTLGLISSYYYLRYTTVGKFKAGLRAGAAAGAGFTFEAALRLLSDASEFDELPGAAPIIVGVRQAFLFRLSVDSHLLARLCR